MDGLIDSLLPDDIFEDDIHNDDVDDHHVDSNDHRENHVSKDDLLAENKITFGYNKNPCYWCGGRGYSPNPSGSTVECWNCSGTGVSSS